MSEQSIKIDYPITNKDFQSIVKLVDRTICIDQDYREEYFQGLSVGEVLVARDGERVVGAVAQCRPGKVFKQISDDHFDLENINYPKADIGFITLVAIDPDHQGKGIGKALVGRALEIQKEFRAKAVGVHCWQGSPGNGSQKLFEHFGFEPLKMHREPWKGYSREVGLEGYNCVVCGNPCTCDELEMIKYL